MRRRLRWWIHNLVAHPLLVLCPPLGERLHDRTEPWGTSDVDSAEERRAQEALTDAGVPEIVDGVGSLAGRARWLAAHLIDLERAMFESGRAANG